MREEFKTLSYSRNITSNLSVKRKYDAPSKTGDIFDSTFAVLSRVIGSYQLNGAKKRQIKH